MRVAALGSSREEIASRARDWHQAEQRAVCDVLEQWAHSTILRATHYPSYFAYNLLRVERDPGISAEELVAIADQALAGYAHRRIDVEDIATAERLRPGLEARDFKTIRLLWMRHQAPSPPEPHVPVEERAGLGTALTRAADRRRCPTCRCDSRARGSYRSRL